MPGEGLQYTTGLGTEAGPGQRSVSSGTSQGAEGGSESPSERLGTSEVGEESPFRKIRRDMSSEITDVEQAIGGRPDTGGSKTGSCGECPGPCAILITAAGEWVDPSRA